MNEAYFCKDKELYIKAMEHSSGQPIHKTEFNAAAVYAGYEIYENPNMAEDIIELREKKTGKVIERYKIPAEVINQTLT